MRLFNGDQTVDYNAGRSPRELVDFINKRIGIVIFLYIKKAESYIMKFMTNNYKENYYDELCQYIEK